MSSPPQKRPVLSGIPPEELAELLHPLPSYRALQIFKWISAGVSSFREMRNLPLSLREDLENRFTVYGSAVTDSLEDRDGTVKIRISLQDDQRIEAVLLSDGKGRRTACLSTQAGCPVGCVFCKTGSLGFSRNLDSPEIVEQFFFLKKLGHTISNIVVMGMGEPLLNLDELRKALRVLCHPDGAGLSPRRITVSTCGIAAGIRELAGEGPPVRLAFSLTAADQKLRERLIPMAAANPLPRIGESLRYFQERGGGRITLEVVLLSGINTRREDAKALADFTAGLDTIVNLIPWNSLEGFTFEGKALKEPSGREIENFETMLRESRIKVTRRGRKGREVLGACGQLGELKFSASPAGKQTGKFPWPAAER
ncbi:MAG: 23S rRNA (adenine(2503)-C(2))-methyltransferase RlmN [Treponema sp.]|jgi:23S rRNA (adenine2503-C2)-methyltransferase|nr:23S rRNA (adenine(2503)-C(2))-methyltransferase RlmN [Treponema sp.]